jgi:lipopolysaccharide cholinephosphotransferase
MINPELQSRLREKFNPDGSPLRRHQLLMLEMLKKIDRICRDNNITYWLSSGTCIGALRHGGFIPWDDDVDIEMYENDFKKLKSIMQKSPVEDLLWQDSNNDPEYVQPFAKIRDKYSVITEVENSDKEYKYRGAFIDIFVLRPNASLRIYKLCGKLQNLCFYRVKKLHNKALRQSLLKFSHLSISKCIYPILSAIGSVGSNGQYRHLPGTAFYKARYKEDIYTTRLAEFEGVNLPVPVNAENYLTKIYGDFNAIPPVESITPHITDIKYLKR